MDKEYDLIVIGSGPGGYIAAIKASQLGMKVAIIENREIGGTCLNRGCIPTKTLMHSSNTYAKTLEMECLGINITGVSFDFEKIHQRKDKIIIDLRSGIDKLVKSNKVEVIKATATIQKDMYVKIYNNEMEETIKSNKILIATGSKPAIIPIEGINNKNVLTSDDLLAKTDGLYKKLLIVGGGVIGVEFATIYRELGADVTILEGQDRILPQMDKEISRTLTMSLKKKGINIITSANVEKIMKNSDSSLSCHYSYKDKEEVETSDGILIAVGRVSNTENLLSDEVLLEMDGRSIKVDDNFETSIDNIYAIGDVVKGMQLAHLASAQGIVAVEHMNKCEVSINLNVVPSCIYTNPEIASVGITQDEAKAKGIKVKVGKFPMLANSKTMISSDERGYIKVIFDDETDKIIGADIISPRATDMIGEMAMAIVNGLTSKQIKAVVRPHPTYEESITDAVDSIK
ncbi:MAG TPA: dihydrolipoyl dehydrogenase [Clostridiales bacterium]|nr:dihydrolipoyl dehydrogenase [Clostridiales bacterium]